MERRSAQRTTPRKRYTVDAFEGIKELQDAVSSDEDPVVRDHDEERDVEVFEARAEQSTDDDEMSDVEADVEEGQHVLDDGSDAGEHLLDDRMSIAEDPEEVQYATPRRKSPNFAASRPRQKVRQAQSGPLTYTRGISERINKDSQHARRLFYSGPSPKDYEPVLSAMRKWAYEPTLSSRIADAKGNGGMRTSLFMDTDDWSRAAEVESRLWEECGGIGIAHKRQALEGTDEGAAADYAQGTSLDPMRFLMGPYKKQRIFKLQVGGSMPLADAWTSDVQPEVQKSGFILNLGGQVQCLAWAPNQGEAEQYLTTSVKRRCDMSDRSSEAASAPAFTPQAQGKSNIQIWRFQSNADGGINTAIKPQLELSIYTTWGDAKDLRWRPLQNIDTERSEEKSLGLLAGIWSDGAVRVFDVRIPLQGNGTRHLHVKKAAFESNPPNTVCTCLTWVSGSRIAVGCANGCIAIWDLSTSLKSEASNPRPLLYSSVSTSYILSIATCYPSKPNLLITVSMSGFLALTDLSRASQGLSSPSATVFSNRVRISQRTLVWHEFAQVALHVEDTFTLKGSSVRRMFGSVSLGRAKSNASSMAASPCHPSVLVGSGSGEVFATNPLGRAVDGRSPIWQQTWFAHEWRRPIATPDQTSPNSATGKCSTVTEPPNATTIANDAQIGSNGICRISEGFKAERINLTNDDRNGYNSHNGVLYATVYEEKSAITALAWNPNPHVGGWAAAGTGSGLLRVENIAL